MHVSLRELVGPYVEESYDNLPAEVQAEVVKYFTPDSWNASSTAGRSSFLRRYDEQVDTERAEIAETLAKHAYWFGLQSEILRTEGELADLRSLAERNSNQGDSGHPTISALQAQPERVNHFETMNLMSLVSNPLDFPRFPSPVLAC